MDFKTYYEGLNLPVFAPPGWLFGVVWPVLYTLIAISFGYGLWQTVIKRRLPRNLAAPMLINLVANALYTPLFFWWRAPLWAAVDIVVVLATIIWIMFAWWPHRKWVSLLQIPYLAWVAFATVLQFTINGRNGW